MKKLAVLAVMFFIIPCFTFADEAFNEFEYISFTWQYYYFKALSDNDTGYFFVKLSENNTPNNNSQNRQYLYVDSHDSNSGFFGVLGGLLIYTGVIYAGSALNRQEQIIINDAWHRQKEEEKMQQDLFRQNRDLYSWF
ncbi:MAG: hypothetical protein FWG99_09030 [Treponema sp.]|nr:hypothetical protein [Treponema sp.]